MGLANNFTPSASDVFGILDNQTGNAITSTFAGIGPDGTVNAVFANNTAAETFQVSYDGDITGGGISIHGGNDIVLYNFAPVPEPVSILAFGALTIGLFGLKRRIGRRE